MSKNRFGVDTDGRLVVLGGGESGVGAAILGKVKGWMCSFPIWGDFIQI